VRSSRRLILQRLQVLPDGTARSGHSPPLGACAPSGSGAAPADVARAQEAGASAPRDADANPEAASSSGAALARYDGPPLSGGALRDIIVNDVKDLRPVLQLLDVTRLDADSGHKLTVSDGVHSYAVAGPTVKLNALLLRGELAQHAVFAVTKYVCRTTFEPGCVHAQPFVPASIAALLARCMCRALTDMRAGARAANSSGRSYRIILLLDIDILCAAPAALGHPVHLSSLVEAADSAAAGC
jgi:hypothetical protein